MNRIIICLLGFMVCCNNNKPQSKKNEISKDFTPIRSELNEAKAKENETSEIEREVIIRRYNEDYKTNGSYTPKKFYSEIPNANVWIEAIFNDSISITDTASGVSARRKFLDITTTKDYYLKLILSMDNLHKQYFITRDNFKAYLTPKLIQKGQLSMCINIDSLSIDTVLILQTRINYPFSDIGILFKYQIKPDGEKEIIKYEKFSPD